MPSIDLISEDNAPDVLTMVEDSEIPQLEVSGVFRTRPRTGPEHAGTGPLTPRHRAIHLCRLS
jgi:hypothetical protein